MKKIMSVLISVILLMNICFAAGAEYSLKSKELSFNNDGKFRIMMMNDFQDIDKANKKSIDFLENVLDYVKPDLVVLVGDQLSNSFSGATGSKIKKAISNICEILDSAGVPFMFTFGNHDHDLSNVLSEKEQAEVYKSFDFCFNPDDGYDAGTFNKVIYSCTENKPVMNVYMMDTNSMGQWWFEGVTDSQVQWYKNTSDKLKTTNDGKILPSILFQHIPCKEIRKLLIKVPEGTPESVKLSFVDNTHDYWIINKDRIISPSYTLGEAPACEDNNTGEYEAWCEKGDIVFGAYFGHDHLNDFVGRTEDGQILGYTAGFGYATYGLGDERSVKVFDFDETDMDNFTFSRVTDKEVKGSQNVFVRFFNMIREFFQKIFSIFRK